MNILNGWFSLFFLLLFHADSNFIKERTIFSTASLGAAQAQFPAGYGCPVGYTLDSINSYHYCRYNYLCKEDRLCGKADPVIPPVPAPYDACADSTFFSVSKGTELYNAYLDSLRGSFETPYRNLALSAYKRERFTAGYVLPEFHYTLYYHDQAGNLLQTVPPAGVQCIRRQSWLDSVKVARARQQQLVPAHRLATRYRYNTLGQVVVQQSPDGGKSSTWYDRLGRLCASQNAKQAAKNAYSYTMYDPLGRVTEVGELDKTGTTGSALNDNISRNPALLEQWLGDGNRSQITQTVYDYAYAPISGNILNAQNLRNRVAYTAVYNTEADYDNGTPATATFYSYDIHGNVDTLVQDYRQGAMADAGNRFKKMVYGYDLISGKVNSVAYQPGAKDAFYHRYEYDAENRLTDVMTSHDSTYWEKDAHYDYYRHGPLARTTLGQQQVQNLDYAYTIHGFLKAINPTTLLTGGQQGNGNGCDSSAAVDNLVVNARLQPNPTQYVARKGIMLEPGFQNNGGDRYLAFIDPTKAICNAPMPIATTDGASGSNVARDAYNLVLNYYDQDYQPIGSGLTSPSMLMGANLGKANRPLYNGNISSMAVNIPKLGTPLLYNYQYDQLNRLVGMDAWKSNSNWSNLTPTDAFKERLTYDANGNILSYLRNGESGILNDYTYHYIAGRNQLASVTNAVNGTTKHFKYDSVGNVIKDEKQKVANANWTLDDKLDSVVKTDGTVIKYTYNAAGERISKTVGDTTEWYVRDGSGNIISMYQKIGTRGNLVQTEIPIYGSSRLGMSNASALVLDTIIKPNGEVWIEHKYIRGAKTYELSNQTGNVQVQVSDRKKSISYSGTTIDHFDAEVINATHYSTYGTIAKAYQSNKLRFAFNGQLKSTEISKDAQTAKFWEYDGDLGRRWNIDPEEESNIDVSPYCVLDNSPIKNEDVDGDDWRDKIAGAVIGAATNIIPFAALTGLRGTYKPHDPADYNHALKATDDAAMALGSAFVKGGGTGAAGGMVLASGGLAVTAGSGGTLAIAGVPATVAGVAAAGAGTVIAGTGAVLMSNSVNNQAKGYDYGKPKQKTETSESTKQKTKEKTHQTYTKQPKNPKDGVYSGKTSGTGTPEQNVAKRDANHHMNDTHQPAVLDKSSKSADAIRGREQQLIDANGGAKKQNGTSGNTNRSVSEKNEKATQYEEAAKKLDK